ncbi:MAG TPA: ABC transporter permease subunit [Tepidisphaeraceae bacterium]
MKKLRKLLGKDWRLNRVIVVGLLLGGAAPYLIATAAFFWDRHEYWLMRSDMTTGAYRFADYPSWRNFLENASSVAMLITALFATIFGGIAFAQERQDRSAEFLAMMPARRSQIIYSKLFVSAVCVLGALAIHECIAAACATRQSHWINFLVSDISQFWAANIGLFGIAYLFSTFLNSPAIATSISIGVLCFVEACIAVFVAMPGNRANGILAIAMTAYIGVAGILVGSVYYARRVAP